MISKELKVGMLVEKIDGDYKFPGIVVSIFKKNSGAIRCVVESLSKPTLGILHIFNPSQLIIRRSCD